ncbi:MAG: hypothetical protein AAGD43_03285 [Pseudomonadota bacterium]
MIFDQFSRSQGMSPQEIALMHARRKVQAGAPRDLNAHKRTMEYRRNPALDNAPLLKPMPAPPINFPEGVSPYTLLGGGVAPNGLSQFQRDSLAAQRPQNGMAGMPITGNAMLDHPAWKGGLPGASGAQAPSSPEPPPAPMFDQFAEQRRRDGLAAQRPENQMTGLMGDPVDGPPQNLGSLGALGAGNPVLNDKPTPKNRNPVLDGLLEKAIAGGKAAPGSQNPVLNGQIEPLRPGDDGVKTRNPNSFGKRFGDWMSNGGAQALMAFGANMLAASGPSSTPTSLGQAVGEGAQGALGAMADYQANEHQQQLRDVQMALMRKRLEGAEATERANAELADQISQARPDLAALAGVDPTAAWEAAFPDRTAKEEAMLRAGIEEGSDTWVRGVLGFNPKPEPAASPSAVDAFKQDHISVGNG